VISVPLAKITVNELETRGVSSLKGAQLAKLSQTNQKPILNQYSKTTENF
jgi:hypothetical protein